MDEQEKKPFYEKWWFWLLIVFLIVFLLGIVGSGEEKPENNVSNKVTIDNQTNKGQSNNQPKKENKKYKIGETWTVDNQWSLTIDSVTTTNERNQFSDKNPAQVIVITYTYENLGYEDDILDGLFISLDSVLDEKGEIAETYPATKTTYAQEIPVGAKCVGAQEIFGLNNVSNKITLNFSKYDSDSNKQKATFELEVQ